MAPKASLFQEAGTQAAGVTPSFRRPCPPSAQRAHVQGAEPGDGPVAGGGETVPTGQSPHMQQTHSAVGRQLPLCLHPYTTWPHPLPAQPPGSMRPHLLTANAPHGPEHPAGRHLLVAWYLWRSSCILFSLRFPQSSPKQVAWGPMWTSEEVWGRARGRSCYHTLLFLHLVSKSLSC